MFDENTDNLEQRVQELERKVALLENIVRFFQKSPQEVAIDDFWTTIKG